MFALPCSYVPKHAAPREPLTPQTRSAVAVGLAAVMLPLGAAPALADSGTSSGGAFAGSTSSAGAAVQPASSAGSDTATVTTASRPVEQPAQASARKPSGAAAKRYRAETELAFRAPAATRGDAVPVGIRLTASGRGVRNGYVRLEKQTSEGWTFVGRLLTDGDGVGQGTLRVAGSSRLRAAYTGSQVRTAAVSPAATVQTQGVDGSAVVQEASRYLGAPYQYGAAGPSAFDCSGFTRYVYGQLGKSLPHNSDAQQQVTQPVSRADAQAGDLVFLPGHVGIYAGDGRMYDAPGRGRHVVLREIYSADYALGRVL